MVALIPRGRFDTMCTAGQMLTTVSGACELCLLCLQSPFGFGVLQGRGNNGMHP